MPKVFGLDVPDYLLPPWQRLVKSVPSVPDQAIALNYPKASKFRKEKIKQTSYITYLKPFFNALVYSARRDWQDFWSTLPFGSHAGVAGYPGSGFSAFVFINVPRLKNGLPIQSFAPGTELVVNGNFAAPFFPNWIGTSRWSIVDGWAVLTGSIDEDLQQALPLILGQNYTFVVDYENRIYTDVDTGLQYGFAKNFEFGMGDQYISGPIPANERGTKVWDFTPTALDISLDSTIYFEPDIGPFAITNVSVRQNNG